MPELIVIDRKGEQSVIQAESTLTLMEAIRDAGVGDILALCGGVCSCATCHVYIASEFSAALPAMSEDEDALLEGCSARNEQSRLACQIRLHEGLSGLRVSIANDD